MSHQLWGDNAIGVTPTQTLGGRVPPVPNRLTPLFVVMQTFGVLSQMLRLLNDRPFTPSVGNASCNW